MNNVKMMLTIARYYSTRERMSCLFRKITNQMITNCKHAIASPGRLWDQPADTLIENLRWSLRLNEAYQDQYRLTREKLLTQPKVKQFDFNEQEVFGKFDLFCKRWRARPRFVAGPPRAAQTCSSPKQLERLACAMNAGKDEPIPRALFASQKKSVPRCPKLTVGRQAFEANRSLHYDSAGTDGNNGFVALHSVIKDGLVFLTVQCLGESRDRRHGQLDQKLLLDPRGFQTQAIRYCLAMAVCRLTALQHVMAMIFLIDSSNSFHRVLST